MADILIDEIMKIKSSKTIGRLEAKLRAKVRSRILYEQDFAISSSADVEFCVAQHYTTATGSWDKPVVRYNHIRDIIRDWDQIQAKLMPSCEFCSLCATMNKPLYEMMEERNVKPKLWNPILLPF